MEEMIDSLPVSYRVGSVVFMTELLKKSLKVETSSWKKAFGRALNHKVYCLPYISTDHCF